MRLLYSRDDWSFAGGFREPSLDFCLWVLQVDGLRVPPFDQHPDGDGSLQAMGLTAPDWQAWFLCVIDPEQRERDIKQLQQQANAEYLKISGEPDLEHLRQRIQAEQLKISQGPLLPPPPAFHFYHASWRGNDAVRNRLIELHTQYKHESSHRELLCADVNRAWDKEERRSGTNLYEELKPYATRIPSLSVYFAVYDYPLDYLVFPATLLMTVQEGQPGPQDYRERVLAAAAELAARPRERSKRSLYTRTRDFGGQFTTAYRRYGRKPIPLALPKQEIPRLADPARQAVLDHLSQRLFYGNVDFTTVQFLREKKRSGWRLYEVTFEEIDGEQHRMIFVFQQEEGGSWRFERGGSSIDMQKEWSRIHVPVRDHPLLFLSPAGFSFDNRTHLLTAYGDVIDNGFHVKQVRLVNDAGQILEDAVEDGYVFFACKIETRVQLPMQAELYDHQGKLVWRQTIALDGELPPG
ncbi:MAG: hypothetical protein J2P37_14180 [Ktedonobacteraceae bacterium]|nr:hypothetical protein [Ktedonobacteraceae bacterium]MBO0789511.1 hypothetical protein [Ktedonobacteraceae bacterium]